MFENMETEYVNILESKEAYHDGYGFYPRITKWWQVSCHYKGIALQTRQYIVGGSLPAHGKRLSQWMEEKNVESVTMNVIQHAIRDIEPDLKYIKEDGKKVSSADKYIFRGDIDNAVEYNAFIMERENNKPVMLKDLLDEEEVCLESCKGAYLHRFSGKYIIWEGTREVLKDEDFLMGEHIGYRMIEAYEDKAEGRKLVSFEDALAYSEYLQDSLCYKTADCSRIIKNIQVSHQLWDLLSFEEIENFVTKYVTDEDALERIDLAEVKRWKEAEDAQHEQDE